MKLSKYKNEILENVIDPMICFMKELGEDCEYTIAHVEKCEELLMDYIFALSELDSPDEDQIMDAVQELVLALNELNEDADYSLIETDSREAICEIIQAAASECGLDNDVTDITEEWREW